MNLGTWWLFVLMTFVVSATPGPNMLYVMSVSARSGLRSAIRAMAGCMTALLAMMSLSAAGLGALLQSFPAVFDTLRLVGAAYLAYLGIKCWRAPVENIPQGATQTASNAEAPAPAPAQAPWRIFVSGMANCLLNPKAYAFMLAVFPGFLRSTERGLAAQGLLLGGIIAGNQVVVYGTVLLACLGSRRWQRGDGRGMTLLSGLMGLSLVGLAIGTLVRAAQGLH